MNGKESGGNRDPISGEVSGENRRRFQRYEVDMPCTVSWKERPLQARLANLSYGGARVTEVVAIPPKDSLVSIAFDFDEEHFEIQALLTSRVVYRDTQSMDEGAAGYFGVEFVDPPEEIRSKLSPIFESTESKPRALNWRFVYPVGLCKECGGWSSMICTDCGDRPYVCDDCTTDHLEAHLSW
jgi:c-di-GMP-binding flagellar brake protein YcgR